MFASMCFVLDFVNAERTMISLYGARVSATSTVCTSEKLVGRPEEATRVSGPDGQLT